MKTISVKSARLFQTLIAIIMIAGLLFPPASVAYAQDEVPPADVPAETQAEAETPEEPQSVELPAEATVEAPVVTEVVAPVEATVEAPVVTEVVLPTEATVEAPAAPSEEPSAAETVAEVVQILNETNTVLVDENGVEIPLTSLEAADLLDSVDPFFYDPINKKWIGYTYNTADGRCPSIVAAGDCHKVDAPLTSALGDSNLKAGQTLYIEGDKSGSRLYNETVTIDREINLKGVRIYKDGNKYKVDESEGSATIATVNLTSTLGSITRVTANNIFVTSPSGKTDVYRGEMLNDALNLIAQNGTITLAAGTYNPDNDDDDEFDVDTSGVTIIGQGDSTILDGKNRSDKNGLDINANNVQVKKLQVISGVNGIRIDGKNALIEDVKVDGNSNTGIIVNNSGATFKNVAATNNGTGVEINSGNLTFNGFIAGDNSIGIDINHDDITLNGATVSGNTDKGVVVRNWVDDVTLLNFILSFNRIGLYAEHHSEDVVINHSNIFGNTQYGVFNNSNDVLNARNNYWGDPDGPTNCYADQYGSVHCGPAQGDKALANVNYNYKERVCFLFWCWDEDRMIPLNVDTGSFVTTCPDGQVNVDGQCVTPPACEEWQTLNEDGLCEDEPCKITGMVRDEFGSCEWPEECEEWQTNDEVTGLCVDNPCKFENQTRDDEGDCVFTDTCAEWQRRNKSTGSCDAKPCELTGQVRDNTDGSCDYAEACPAGTERNVETGGCDLIPGGGGGGGDGGAGDGGGAGILGFVGGVGGGGVIPVTGGLNQLSCTEANTLVLANGNKVGFSAPLCGLEAGLADENGQTLPAPLPDGMAFASGMTLTLQKGATTFNVLPDPVTDTLSFVIPAELKDKTFYIMFWDAAANGGLGAWVEIPAKVTVNGAVVSAPLTGETGETREVVSGMEVTALLTGETTLNFTGTFVLAYK